VNAETTFPLHWIPLLPFIGAAINLIFGRKLSRRTIHIVACTSVALAAVLALDVVITKLMPMWWEGRKTGAAPLIVDHWFTWIQAGSFKVDLSFALDTLSAVMICTVTFVGFLIHVYSTGYMAHDPRPHAYFGYLNLFTAAMLVLVLGDSLPVMFIGWEGVGVCSYLLIGFWFDKEKNANAGRKAFVVNRIGDFAFLIGIFLLFKELDTVSFAGLTSVAAKLSMPYWWNLPLAFWAGLFLFIGACGKSAQIPLYVWLPDAMAGPTPVSALIHAATMVTAGVYMVCRLGFLYLQAPQVMLIVAAVGTLTALVAAIIGFAQTDIKKVLAYSTVSQLGFMFAAAGVGAFTAAIFHLFTHAFFKAGLFLGAGSVMHAMGDRTEIMEMGGLRHKIPITHKTFLIYCLAIAGIFPFAGFFSKDEILLGAYATQHMPHWPSGMNYVIWGVLSLTALGTAFYMWRLYFLVFWGETRADEETKKHIHESPAVMTGPLVVLAVGAVVLGFAGLPHVGGLPNAINSWLDATYRSWGYVQPEVHEVSQGGTLGLMLVSLGLGILGIFIAHQLYSRGPEKARSIVASMAGLHKVVLNKFYVDELYDLVIVRPFRFLANVTYNFVDRFVIDLVLVNGSAFVADVFGRLLRFVQNGDVQRYFAATVFGLVAIFYFTAGGNDVGFKSKGNASEMTFTADIGRGPGAEDVDVKWDFDGDGQADREGVEVTWQYAQPGRHKVTLSVQDGMYPYRTVHKVTREVEVKP
jgi:NADH-quinone oxidoreductase subunit L